MFILDDSRQVFGPGVIRDFREFVGVEATVTTPITSYFDLQGAVGPGRTHMDGGDPDTTRYVTEGVVRAARLPSTITAVGPAIASTRTASSNARAGRSGF